MMYLINGTVIVMLLVFFAALAMESKPGKFASGKTFADIKLGYLLSLKKIFRK